MFDRDLQDGAISPLGRQAARCRGGRHRCAHQEFAAWKKGDWRAVGEGVCELRFLQTGPGWRVYFHETNLGCLILLLLGGDKASQHHDIEKAKKILAELKATQAAIRKQKQAASNTNKGRKQ